jgi:hypothetical protein
LAVNVANPSELELQSGSQDSAYPVYSPDAEEQLDIQEVLGAYVTARNVMQRQYEYFNGRNLFECIDDWTKRWNGYIPPLNPLMDQTSWNIFYNFTRNAIIAYLARVALNPVKANIIAVNKKSKLQSKKFAEACKDMNQYSLNEENGPARFLESAIEAAVKGTVVVYEGYMKNFQTEKVIDSYDQVTGKVKYKKKKKVIFDNCYQKVVPLEDFYITNAYEPDVQKQPRIIWRNLTTYSEAQNEFSHYKNWGFVRPGNYTLAMEMQTFYRQAQLADLPMDRVEILRYYCKRTNSHIVLVNGVVMYSGPIPFKDGNYPFAKTVNEPFGNDFFWGQGMPGKYMGEQDMINSFINMMAQKTTNSLLPTGLSSDLDDLIEDDVIEIGKIRQVSDVEKWKWWEAPAVNGGEFNMFQTIMNLAKDSANVGAGDLTTASGGKVTARQVLLKQQELVQKLSFNTNYLEDLEVDRTKLRVSHLLQFYAIPRIERITGQNGKEIENAMYRDIVLPDTELSDGRKGTKILKIIGDEHVNPDSRQALEDELSVKELTGEEQGIPTEAMAISADMFQDFDTNVQVVKNSSFERNQALNQAAALEFANWRLSIAQVVPIANPMGLVEHVEESFDIDPSKFEEAPEGQMQQSPIQQQQLMQQGMLPQQGGAGGPDALQQTAPSQMGGMSSLLEQ